MIYIIKNLKLKGAKSMGGGRKIQRSFTGKSIIRKTSGN